MTLLEVDSEGNVRSYSIASASHQENIEGGRADARYGVQARIERCIFVSPVGIGRTMRCGNLFETV